MKSKAKKNKRFGSIEKVFKNEQLFLRLYTKPEFAKAILKFWDKFNHVPESFIYAHSIKTLAEVRALNKVMRNKREQFFLSLSKQRRIDLIQSIQEILNDFNLGQEWLITIADFLINGYLMPPSIDLHYQIEKRNGRKVAVIEIGPETSIDDFKMIISKIKDMQKLLYPKYKKHNLSKKFPKHFNIFTEDLMLENVVINGGLDDEKYKRNDIDLATEFFNDEKDISLNADNKRAGLLRQIRHRLKKP